MRSKFAISLSFTLRLISYLKRGSDFRIKGLKTELTPLEEYYTRWLSALLAQVSILQSWQSKLAKLTTTLQSGTFSSTRNILTNRIFNSEKWRGHTVFRAAIFTSDFPCWWSFAQFWCSFNLQKPISLKLRSSTKAKFWPSKFSQLRFVSRFSGDLFTSV